MAKQYWPAPAKINLFLHILGRLDNGYHELQSLFQLLDWGDQLQITVTDTPLISVVNPGADWPPESDLCFRAARLLQQTCSVSLGAEIVVDKQIPVSAGLGGGSSDAATVLRVLNQLWRCDLTTDELAEMGLQLGADVPCFVHGKSAWAEGVGQKLSPVSLGDPWYVLVFPEVAISTAEIFSAPALTRDSAPLIRDQYDYHKTRNDCEPVVLQRYPGLQKIMLELSRWGEPRLTGTGSCIFLPVRSKRVAIDVTQTLKPRYNVRAVQGTDQSVLLASL